MYHALWQTPELSPFNGHSLLLWKSTQINWNIC